MSSGGIQFGGLASGLDTQSIIRALLAVEQRPIAQLEQKRTNYERQKRLFNDFDGLLDKLKEKAEAIKDTADFLEFSASTDNEDRFFRASASNSAAAGTYDIAVTSLANSEIKGSTGAASRDQQTGASGVLKITVDGVDKFVTIDPSETSLDQIASKLNATADLGVTAQVVDNGQASNNFQLVLTSETTGLAGGITITADSGTTELTALAGDINGNTIRPGSDALLTLNGVQIRRTSNTISDLIPGVTLNLTASDATVPPETTRLTVATDTEATGNKVKAFVDAYNEVVDFVQGQFQVGSDGTAQNPLFGDSTLRGVRTSLRSIVGGSVDTGNASYSLFAQIGIEADRDGKLTFNQGEFGEALAGDEDAVRNLFANATSGIATRISNQVDTYVDTVDGLFKARLDGFDRLIKDTNNQIERSERRLDRYEEQLNQRFANLEVLLNRLQGQGGALGSLPVTR